MRSTLAQRERWLVLNKTDLVDAQTLAERRAALLEALDWQGPVYETAAISSTGTDSLCGDLMTYLEECREREAAEPELAEAEAELQNRMQAEARQRIEQLRAERRAAERSCGFHREASVGRREGAGGSGRRWGSIRLSLVYFRQ